MTILDPSMISKWENLQNSKVFKYLLSSLYMQKKRKKKKKRGLINGWIHVKQQHSNTSGTWIQQPIPDVGPIWAELCCCLGSN